jgi:hypothetical protein
MDVGTVVFYASQSAGEGWPRMGEFEQGGAFQPPFVLEMNTPSGPFEPVRSARTKLNGREVASVAWPTKPTTSIAVELLDRNKIEFQLEGPRFGSVEVTIRGKLVGIL